MVTVKHSGNAKTLKMMKYKKCPRETLCYADINTLKHTYNNFLKYITIWVLHFLSRFSSLFLIWHLDSCSILKVNFWSSVCWKEVISASILFPMFSPYHLMGTYCPHETSTQKVVAWSICCLLNDSDPTIEPHGKLVVYHCLEQHHCHHHFWASIKEYAQNLKKKKDRWDWTEKDSFLLSNISRSTLNMIIKRCR